MKANKAISITTAALVFLVALGSFALSYTALRDMAARNGIDGTLSYIWPLLIDLALIVFSLSVVNSYLQSENTKKQWALVGIYTIATIGFNIAHAPNNLQAQVVAAIAPVSLFFSFELLMSQLRTSVKKHSITQNIEQLSRTVSQKQIEASELDTILAQKSSTVSNLKGEIDTLKAQIVELRKERILTKNGVISPSDTSEQAQNDTSLQQANDTRQAQIEGRREQVLILSEQGMSQLDIADELGVSIATIKRDAKALNGRMATK